MLKYEVYIYLDSNPEDKRLTFTETYDDVTDFFDEFAQVLEDSHMEAVIEFVDIDAHCLNIYGKRYDELNYISQTDVRAELRDKIAPHIGFDIVPIYDESLILNKIK